MFLNWFKHRSNIGQGHRQEFRARPAVFALRRGAFRDNEGVAERALFVIDETGRIVWSHLSPIAVSPGADGILDVLERMPKLETADV